MVGDYLDSRGRHGDNDFCRFSCGEQQWGTNDDNSHKKAFEESELHLAREMNALSVQERERVLDDIHGVSEVQNETPEFLETSLAHLDQAIASLYKYRSLRKALDRAFFLRPALKHDAEFKLMFLRSVDFDAVAAARKMANYFTVKLEIFGESKLVKTIAMEDLQEQDIKILKSGCFFELQNRDPVGRPIMFVDFSRFDLSDQDSMVRAAWFSMISCCDDKDAQRKGGVNIAYAPGGLLSMKQPFSSFCEHFGRMRKIVPAIPRHITSNHFCCDDVRLNLFFPPIQDSVGKSARLRSRFHIGSHVEIEYSLLTFGISCQRVMQDDSERQKLSDLHFQNIANAAEEKSWKEKEPRPDGKVLYPSPDDALIGRGHPYHDVPGTRRLLAMIDSHLDRYNQSDDRFWKTCMAMEVVKQFQERNGRFLQRTETGWTVLDAPAARAKVTNLFWYKNKGRDSKTSENVTTKRPKYS